MSLLLAHSCPGRVRRHVAIKERAELEIIFPRVSGYRRDLPSEKLEAAFTADSRLEITPADIGPTSVVMEGIVGAGVTITPQVLERLRPSEISFNLAKHLLYARFRDDEGFPKQHLFPHIQRLARRWLDEGDLVTKGVPIGAILYQDQLARAAEKIDIALTRGSEGRLLAVLDPYNPKGSTQVSRGRSFSYAIAITIKCIRVMSRRPGWEKALYRGIPAGSPVDGIPRGAASWRNVSTVIIATRKSHGKPPNTPNAR